MSNMNLRTSFSGTASLVLLLLAAVIFSSCAKKIRFLISSVVPAAQGKVQVKKDKNNNYAISVSISDLADVSRLTPARKTYIVWMQTSENLTRNIGQINSNTGHFSKRLKAAFETVSSFRPVQIFITAEDEADIRFPGAQMVLTTGRF